MQQVLAISIHKRKCNQMQLYFESYSGLPSNWKVLNSRIIPKIDVTKEKNEMYPQMQMNDYAILS